MQLKDEKHHRLSTLKLSKKKLKGILSVSPVLWVSLLIEYFGHSQGTLSTNQNSRFTSSTGLVNHMIKIIFVLIEPFRR